MATTRQKMAKLDFNIGSQVHCKKDESCGKLLKVVVDPHTERVTDLIVERGFLQKIDRVLPVSAVERTTDQDIYLSISGDELEDYPEYREVEFRKPAPGWGEAKQYKAEHTRYWVTPHGGFAYHEPAVPRVRREVHEGISSEMEVIEPETPVHNVEGMVVGKVDHVLVDRESGEITHLVVRRGLIPYYPIVPISMIEYVSEESVYVKATTEEIKQLPRYRPRAATDVLAELQDRLEASSFDFSSVKPTLEGGLVRLTGLVHHVAAKRRAEAIARSIGGVIDVENALDTDTAIVARVTAALLDDLRTSTAVIKVLSEQGVVTLRGQADSPRVREAAEEIAAEQRGVVQVVNELEIKPDEDTEFLELPVIGN